MTEKILVPVLGESIAEATITKWLKNKGDNINADEPLVELETNPTMTSLISMKSFSEGFKITSTKK